VGRQAKSWRTHAHLIAMGIDAEMIFMVVGIVVATLLLTGPGLWSHRSGWKTLERLSRKKPRDS
jgi:hypothetical protein